MDLLNRVKVNESKKAIITTCNLLEESGLYKIIGRDHLGAFVTEKKEVRENPLRINIVLANAFSIKGYIRQIERNAERGFHTVPIFYKNGKSAFIGWEENNEEYNAIFQMLTRKEQEKEIREKKYQDKIRQELGLTITFEDQNRKPIDERVRQRMQGMICLGERELLTLSHTAPLMTYFQPETDNDPARIETLIMSEIGISNLAIPRKIMTTEVGSGRGLEVGYLGGSELNLAVLSPYF